MQIGSHDRAWIAEHVLPVSNSQLEDGPLLAFYEEHASAAVNVGVAFLTEHATRANLANCAWLQVLHAAAEPDASFATRLRAVSAMFDVGVSTDVKARVPCSVSVKDAVYASYPLTPPYGSGCWSTWPDSLVRLASELPNEAEIGLLEKISLPSTAEVEDTLRRVRSVVDQQPRKRKRERTETQEAWLQGAVPRFSRDHALGRADDGCLLYTSPSPRDS